jgi:hypothetical protein
MYRKRISQVFNEIQTNPHDIKNDKLMLSYCEVLLDVLKKHEKSEQ